MVARLVTVYVLHDTQGTAHSLSSMSILASLPLSPPRLHPSRVSC